MLPEISYETRAAGQADGRRPVALVERVLEPLIERYMSGRREDIEAIRQHPDPGDLEDVRVRGHQMKGSGGGYGFDEISEIGAGLEEAAECRDTRAVAELIGRLEHYMDTVEVRYLDE
jgi:hypothetical protein